MSCNTTNLDTTKIGAHTYRLNHVQLDDEERYEIWYQGPDGQSELMCKVAANDADAASNALGLARGFYHDEVKAAKWLYAYITSHAYHL